MRFAACLLLAVAAAGCSRQASSDQNAAQATASAAAATAAAAMASAAAAQASVAAAQPTAAPAQPQTAATVAAAGIASSDGEASGTKVVVTSLERSSDTVTLKLALINDSSSSIDTHEFSASGYNGWNTFAGIHLIDTVGKKKYFPLSDSEHNCICSQDVPAIQPHSQANVWAKFPAPPPSVTKIGIEVAHFIPLDNVPISQ
jgi:hypothetical protein